MISLNSEHLTIKALMTWENYKVQLIILKKYKLFCKLCNYIDCLTEENYKIQTSKILNEINELQYEKIKADVLNQLSISNEKNNSYISSFLLKKKALNIAKQNFEIAHDRKNIGLINSFNLRDIEIAYINSALSIVCCL